MFRGLQKGSCVTVINGVPILYDNDLVAVNELKCCWEIEVGQQDYVCTLHTGPICLEHLASNWNGDLDVTMQKQRQVKNLAATQDTWLKLPLFCH